MPSLTRQRASQASQVGLIQGITRAAGLIGVDFGHCVLLIIGIRIWPEAETNLPGQFRREAPSWESFCQFPTSPSPSLFHMWGQRCLLPRQGCWGVSCAQFQRQEGLTSSQSALENHQCCPGRLP